jgi:glutamate--cysteine ligase
MTQTIPARFLAQLGQEAFALGRPAPLTSRIGAEVEFIPVLASTSAAAPIDDRDEASTLPVLRALGRRLGWCEMTSVKAGVPEFRTAAGGRITYEPGGQIEYSAPPHESVSDLIADLQGVAASLEEALGERGIALVFAGIDPVNPIESVPLRLTSVRYRRMDAHFASIGPHGARMMRQTASVQVCLDAGADPLARWGLLNAVAPYLVALFANSPVYAGEVTGHASTRRFIWGVLDPARTGIIWDPARPVEAYGDFAMNAAALFGGEEAPPFSRFGDLVALGAADDALWREHLSTLFPEVRPRGYFEVRSIDALEPASYAAPLVLLAGLVYAPDAAREAASLLPAPDASLLERAGRDGLADRSVAAVASDLAELALRGAASSGTVTDPDLEAAAIFLERRFRDRMSPAGAPGRPATPASAARI